MSSAIRTAGDFSTHGEETRRREYRRMMIASALAHGGLVAAFALAPGTPTRPYVPTAISVELVAPPAAAPKPAAVPAKAPAPPKPVAKKQVIPKEPPPLASSPKPRPKPTPRAAPPPPTTVEEDYEDVLAQLREEVGEPETAAPSATTAAAAPGPLRPGPGAVDPEVAAWVRRAKIHVRRNWVVPPGFRTEPLETHLQVELDAQGRVMGEPEILRRSGNPWYDEGVVRALEKASPLPAPPRAGRYSFVFVPEDSY